MLLRRVTMLFVNKCRHNFVYLEDRPDIESRMSQPIRLSVILCDEGEVLYFVDNCLSKFTTVALENISPIYHLLM